MSARLALIGAAGCGKSTVAAALARRSGSPLLDTDADYEAEHGHTVADAVVADEERFRVRERRTVLAALSVPGAVVAVGSGAPQDPQGAGALADVPVVWLKIGLPEGAKRTGLSGARPVAMGNVRAQLHQMLMARAAVYEPLADLVVPTDGRTVDEVVARIEQWEAHR
jgi:shikimate kinase